MNLKNKILHIIIAALCVIGIIASATVCAPCPSGMRCVHNTHAVMILFGISAVSALAGLRLHKYIKYDFAARLMIDIGCIYISATGGCKMPDMRCNMVTFPTLRILAILMLILEICNIIVSLREQKCEKTDHKEHSAS